MQSSSGASVPASTAVVRTVRPGGLAQSYLSAAGANQSNNNNPVMRSAVSRSVAGPMVYANVSASAEPASTTSGRARMQPSGLQLLVLYCRISPLLVIKPVNDAGRYSNNNTVIYKGQSRYNGAKMIWTHW